MAHLKFNHVFIALLALSALSAFVVSPRMTDRVRQPLAGVFWPVSRPAHLAGTYFLADSVVVDDGAPAGPPRATAVVYEENERLRVALANQSGELDELRKINADRAALGDVRELCTPVPVIGSDAGLRESLILPRGSAGALRSGQPVLYAGGIAGRIERAGGTGALVRLITDNGFRVTGSFGRFQSTADGRIEFVRIALPAPLVEGAGNGTMVARYLRLEDVRSAQLGVNDWVVLDDGDWPMSLAGYRLGRVVSIQPRPDAPGFAEIRLQPARNLMGLREVMVMNR